LLRQVTTGASSTENGQQTCPDIQERLPIIRTRNRLPHTQLKLIVEPIIRQPLALSPIAPSSPLRYHHTNTLNMSSEMQSLCMLAHSKLSLSASKDSNSLHRWVLLKNSIIHSATPPPSTTEKPAYSLDEEVDEDDSDDTEDTGVEIHSYMFPDAGNFVDGRTVGANPEVQWLDSVLEGLVDDDEDDFGTDSEDVITSVLPSEDDDFFTPMSSPTSSSTDLPHQPAYYPSPIVSYPVSLRPPLVSLHDFTSPFAVPLTSLSSPYDEDPLPYHEVPDAIEDTSDDESDAPTTPSLGRSSSTSVTPLSHHQNRHRGPSSPQVYVESNDSDFYHFELDPLPFPVDHGNRSYIPYQEC